MIKGIGNDIIEIERIRKSLNHAERFLDRIFTKREQNYCLKFNDPVPHLAGKFAAKEAISKAFGTGLGKQIYWHDLEILNEESGKPKVLLSKRIDKAFNNPLVFLSISHCKFYATAIAIWVK